MWEGRALFWTIVGVFLRATVAALILAVTDPGTLAPVGIALAKLAIATELFLAFGLWRPRTRAFALWWGVMFHLTIEATSRVEIFTWLSLTVYVLFATPDVRARRLVGDPNSALVRVVRGLDWLDRFEVDTGPTIAVIDRDGTRRTGLGAAVGIARAIPMFFPLWLPLAALERATAVR